MPLIPVSVNLSSQQFYQSNSINPIWLPISGVEETGFESGSVWMILARAMELIAEGLETKDRLDNLMDNDWKEIQGYYI